MDKIVIEACERIIEKTEDQDKVERALELMLIEMEGDLVEVEEEEDERVEGESDSATAFDHLFGHIPTNEVLDPKDKVFLIANGFFELKNVFKNIWHAECVRLEDKYIIDRESNGEEVKRMYNNCYSNWRSTLMRDHDLKTPASYGGVRSRLYDPNFKFVVIDHVKKWVNGGEVEKVLRRRNFSKKKALMNGKKRGKTVQTHLFN